jgi:micrococcal nuclease
VWTYYATILHVVDGDTLDADIDVGFYLRTTQRLRLLGAVSGGVNAYELHDPDPAKRALGIAGRDRVAALLPVSTVTVIKTQKKDAFGRFLAAVTLPDGRDLGDLLIAEGLATVWH